jgi:predicted transcriptional regulator of viral defense system
LPNNRRVDLHLRNSKDEDLLVEVKQNEIGPSAIGQLVDYHSAMQNTDPPLKNPKLLLIAKRSSAETAKQLRELGIDVRSFKEILKQYKKSLENSSERLSRLLSTEESRLVIKWQYSKRRIITVDSVVKELKCSRAYARSLLSRIERKQWLERVTKGVYIFIPSEYGYSERYPPSVPLIIGANLVRPYYLSYSTANAYYSLSAQKSSITYIATRKRRPPLQWREMTFKFVTLSDKKFFGFKEVTYSGEKIKIAEAEKAVIDSIDKMAYSGGVGEIVRIVQKALLQVNNSKLVDSALAVDSFSVCQRLGFIIDFLVSEGLTQFPQPELEKLRDNVGRTRILLDNRRPRTGRYVPKWKVIVNANDAELLGEVPR